MAFVGQMVFHLKPITRIRFSVLMNGHVGISSQGGVFARLKLNRGIARHELL